jgi:hypothetical protein
MERVNQIGLLEQSRRDLAIIDEYGARLGQLHRLHPGKVEECLIDYARSYWPSYDAPIFKGFQFAAQAKRVLCRAGFGSGCALGAAAGLA